MNMLRIRLVGLSLSLRERLAFSAAAEAITVNELFGGKLRKEELVLVGLKSEEMVFDYHDDNVGPAIMGGFVVDCKVLLGFGKYFVDLFQINFGFLKLSFGLTGFLN
ncbi:homoserine kinase [Quercus suber]|uniref:Homoserine kinase n=1 Tax=Quercus suber TaxID=58331 RepID=A0AAW0IY49_QUESU